MCLKTNSLFSVLPCLFDISEAYGEVGLDSDSHVVASTLLHVLKEMVPSFFHEIYDDLLAVEMTEDIILSKKTIVEQINKLDVQHCELASRCF